MWIEFEKFSDLQSSQVFEVKQSEDLECVAECLVALPLQLGRHPHAVLGEVHRLALRHLIGLRNKYSKVTPDLSNCTSELVLRYSTIAIWILLRLQ